MSLSTIFVTIGAGYIYNSIATYLNNIIFETASINDKTTVFNTNFMCPIASATILNDLDINTENKWTMLFGDPERGYKVYCFPTFTSQPTIIYNIDEFARENKMFMKANIRVVD
jgi:hypothetical protein